jgi:processive 1,2-diacylglycerol beta-glucosyltransferase
MLNVSGVQAIAFCGRSARALRRIERWKKAHPDFPLHVEGYSTRVHELLQASDCVVSRGGANTTAEALFLGCPILFNRLGGVMPQERLTLNYFIGHGTARQFSTARAFEVLLRELSGRPETLAALRANLRLMRSGDHPSNLARRLLALAAQAGPSKP